MHMDRIVLTGVGLTSPNGNSISEFRDNLLRGVANIQEIDMRYMGKVPAGVCDFEATKYQSRKELRVGTRAGSIAIYCASEAIANNKNVNIHSKLGKSILKQYLNFIIGGSNPLPEWERNDDKILLRGPPPPVPTARWAVSAEPTRFRIYLLKVLPA